MRKNGYPLSLLYDNLGKIGARSVTVAIDACFSGSSHRGMLITAASLVAPYFSDSAVKLEKGAVFTSCSGSEISSWYQDGKHGLFTYFFLKGLQGAADRDRDGQISCGELHSYVSDRSDGVPYAARRLYGRRQTPQFVGDNARIIRGKVQ